MLNSTPNSSPNSSGPNSSGPNSQRVSGPNDQSAARKAIFASVRTILGRGFERDEITHLDHALDHILAKNETGRKTGGNRPVPKTVREIGEEGTSLIKLFEGCAKRRSDGRIEAYPDPGTGAEPWTIGWGATGLIDKGPVDKGASRQSSHKRIGQRIGRGLIWTQEQCDARLTEDLKIYAADVTRALDGAECSQKQFDALVSFHYNTGAIGRATLTRKHKAGDFEGATREFARWNRAGGRVMKGLSRRRKAEAKLYRSGF